MIRALHVVNSLVAGGAENLILQLCRCLPEHGVEPAVASLLGPDRLSPVFERDGIPTIHLSAGRRLDPRAFWRLVAAIRRHRIDIVHTHLVYAGIAGKLAAGIAGVPSVTTRHYLLDPREGSPLFRLEGHLTAHAAARLVVLNETMRAASIAQGLAPAGKIAIHRNAIDLSPFRGLDRRRDPEAPFTIGTIGRMGPEKAHETFLRAIARVRRERPTAQGVLVGDGRRRLELEALRHDLGLDDAVRFVGVASPDEIPGWLARFDVFALSSDWEGVPIALIEAAASGLPIVATAVGGVPEIVHDGETGYLVPPQRPQELADAILRLADDPELRRLFGLRAAEHARATYDIHRLARETADLYREVRAEWAGR